MRSSRPMPGNPWPHDMVLTIEDDAAGLLELLWAREAWGLAGGAGDLPPLLADPVQAVPDATFGTPATPRPSADTLRAWARAWPDLWHAALTHAATGRDPDVVASLGSPTLGTVERAELVARLRGPSARDVFGPAAFPDAYAHWQAAYVERLVDAFRTRRTIDEEPERRSLDALVPAWRAGLTRIVVIPCEGTFTRRVGDHALLVTSATRADPDEYAAALRSFARPGDPDPT